MASRHASDVLVVGAGPVGMLAALALAERGLDVEIVDEEWRTTARSYALALHATTLGLLAGVDRGGDRPALADALVERGHRIDRIAFYDREAPRASVDLSSLGGEYPFVLVLPQKHLEDLLEERLERHGVRVRWNHRLADLRVGDGGPSTATIERLGKESTGYSVATTVWVVEKTEEIASRFVIGADGHRSRVRRALGAEFPSLASPELYAVFEVAPGAGGEGAGAGPEREVRVVVDDGAADVLWPLGAGHRRWSFQLQAESPGGPLDERTGRPDKSRLAVQVGRQSFPSLSREAFGALIAERAPWFDEPEGELAWSVAVQFERRLAAPLGRDGVWLAGDAAHLGAPIGVHSMNAGLAEVLDLAERIAREGGDGDYAAYERRVRGGWQRLQELSEGKGVDPAPGADPWVREHAGVLLASLPASGEHLARLAEQLGLKL